MTKFIVAIRTLRMAFVAMLLFVAGCGSISSTPQAGAAFWRSRCGIPAWAGCGVSAKRWAPMATTNAQRHAEDVRASRDCSAS